MPNNITKRKSRTKKKRKTKNKGLKGWRGKRSTEIVATKLKLLIAKIRKTEDRAINR